MCVCVCVCVWMDGLERCWVSDHYMPWWHDGGFAGATWPWLGAPSQDKQDTRWNFCNSTNTKIPSCNCSQVFSTLGYMFPDRVFLTVGTGEAVNEIPSGNNWPSNMERFERLKEAIALIKRLWTEEWVKFNGKYDWVKDSNLYTKPQKPIPLFVATIKPQSAMRAREEGDGLVTNEFDLENLKNKVLPAFREGLRNQERITSP